MDINANDLNAPDEFDNPYDFDYELNQLVNDDLEPNTEDNEKSSGGKNSRRKKLKILLEIWLSQKGLAVIHIDCKIPYCMG